MSSSCDVSYNTTREVLSSWCGSIVSISRIFPTNLLRKDSTDGWEQNARRPGERERRVCLFLVTAVKSKISIFDTCKTDAHRLERQRQEILMELQHVNVTGFYKKSIVQIVHLVMTKISLIKKLISSSQTVNDQNTNLQKHLWVKTPNDLTLTLSGEMSSMTWARVTASPSASLTATSWPTTALERGNRPGLRL